MNKGQWELCLVEKAIKQAHRFRQPSWLAYCTVLDSCLESAFQEAEEFQTRITIRCLPIHFHPTPFAGTPVQEIPCQG